MKKNRRMKVYRKSVVVLGDGNYYSRTKYKDIPQIILQGEWMRSFGFAEGMPINVECDDGKLIITATDDCMADSNNC